MIYKVYIKTNLDSGESTEDSLEFSNFEKPIISREEAITLVRNKHDEVYNLEEIEQPKIVERGIKLFFLSDESSIPRLILDLDLTQEGHKRNHETLNICYTNLMHELEQYFLKNHETKNTRMTGDGRMLMELDIPRIKN